VEREDKECANSEKTNAQNHIGHEKDGDFEAIGRSAAMKKHEKEEGGDWKREESGPEGGPWISNSLVIKNCEEKDAQTRSTNRKRNEKRIQS